MPSLIKSKKALIKIFYIFNSITFGLLVIYTTFFYYNLNKDVIKTSILFIAIISIIIKFLYWYSLKKTVNNINTTESGYIDNKRNHLLKLTSCVFINITPAYYIAQQSSVVMNDKVIFNTLVVIMILVIVGMLIERNLFNIELK